MLSLLSHGGPDLERSEVLTDWHLEPSIVLAITVAATLWMLGRRDQDGRRREIAFWLGLGAVAVALLGPVDAAAGALLSAHMVQHVLLVLLAAPLLAVAAPGPVWLRGTPLPVRQRLVAARRVVGLGPASIARLRDPVVRWALYVGVFWLWHASVLYDAAVEHDWVHAAEHVSFLTAAWLAWTPIVGPARGRLPVGLGILAVFTLGLQAGLLSALMTFSTSPWYAAHVERAPDWAPDPLVDQQAAGVVMWVPAGLIHAAVAVWLIVSWLGDTDRHTSRRPGDHTDRATDIAPPRSRVV